MLSLNQIHCWKHLEMQRQSETITQVVLYVDLL